MNSTTTETITSFLEKILQDVHPLMAEGICLAAVPNWYNVALFSAMRSRDDGRDQGIVDRLRRYSFIVPLHEEGEDGTTFAVRPEERLFLRRYWIVKDRQAYLNAHERAFAYLLRNPDPNPFVQAESRLYHQLQVDTSGGMDYLVDRFRAYHRDRQLSAIDRLLETAVDARFYLVLLENESLNQLDDLLTHLQARLSQLRGKWSESLDSLKSLREKSELAPWLLPYVARAYGYALAQTGDFVGAIGQYSFALDLFTQGAITITGQAAIQAERAHTMIAMGEAHVDLATSVRGHQEKSVATTGGLALLRDFFHFFLSLPLVLYLSFYLGRRVWHPRFWPTLEGLDWIVARLFATGAKLYTRADPILEAYGAPAESVNADEQLAHLYLAMGDAEQAGLLFSQLLEGADVPLGDYRQASLRVGLGEALTAMGQYPLARQNLESALPVLSLYQDAGLFAEAEMFLAEALLQSGETSEIVDLLGHALGSFQRQGNGIMASEVAERLELLAHDARVEEGQQTASAHIAGRLIERHYPMRYRHPATAFFHRAAIGLLAVIIFVIFATIIRLDTGITIAPEITFNASPLLRSDTPDFTPDLSQGVVALNVTTIANSRFLLWLGAVLFGLYLLLSTGIGILAIINLSLKKVQESSQAGLVRFDGDELQVGEGDLRQVVRLRDVRRLYQSDLFFVDALLMDDSAMTLVTADQRIRLKGSTTWYASVRDRIAGLVPGTAERVDFSYSLIRSWQGAWYLATIAALLLLSFIGQFAAEGVIKDLPGLRYSLADLYPLLYFGLFLPPIWWFVLQPLRVRLHTEPLHSFPWWIGGAGVTLALISLLTLFRPWLTIPEIYAPLLILSLVAGSAVVIFRLKRPETQDPLYPIHLRSVVVLAAAAICLLTIQSLWRELAGYHYRVMGDSWRDQALSLPHEPQQTVELKNAVDAYSRAIEISDTKLLGIDGRSAANSKLGIPPPAHFTWVTAMGSRAAMLSQLGQYEAAIDDYSELLDHVEAPADVYADRAIAFQRLGTTPTSDYGALDVARQNYDAALADFNEAIALDPKRADYLLWRGVAYHALGDVENAAGDYQNALEIEGSGALSAEEQSKAWTGLGWISFVAEDYELAIEQFQQAQDSAADFSGALVGLGYAHYSLRQYVAALQAWEQAVELNQTDPIVFTSLGTLYWRMATLGTSDYGVSSGSDRCSSSSLTQAEKNRSATQLEKSILNLGRATEIPGQEPADLAFTFRTMGQVQYLLRNCPGYDTAETLKGSVAYYEQAVSYAPDNAGYWHIKGRLAYTVWLNSPPGSGPSAREWLFVGLADQEKALALNPEDSGDYRPNGWWATTYAEAVDGTLARGDQRYEDGDYQLAAGYYELVATNRPEHVQSAFLAGLARLANGDRQAAVDWYTEAFARAKTARDEAAVKDAGAKLQELMAEQSSIQLAQIEELFSQNGVDLALPLDASALFTQAYEAIQQQNFAQAADLYTQGMAAAVARRQFSLAATAAVRIHATTLADDMLPLLKQTLPQLEQGAGSSDTTPDDAFKIALFAGAAAESLSAARWYNEGIRLSAVNVDYPPLRNTRDDLKELWALTGVESDAVLAQMQRQLPAQLTSFPELAESGLFWRFRAWFKYGLGLAAFRLGEETAARSALASGQSDAERAVELDRAGNVYVQSYLLEGAWGWYHVERGNDFLAANELKLALADFETAVRSIVPVNNNDVRNDVVIAAFKAGYTAILLSDSELSTAWYQQGVELMRKYGSDPSVLLDAIDELENLSEQQLGPQRLVDSALKYLREVAP